MNHTITRFCLLTLMVIVLTAAQVMGQATQIRGTVVNADNDPLVGAAVFIPELRVGTYTNEEGIFALPKLEPGVYDVASYFFGFDTAYQTITVVRNKTVTTKFILDSRQIFTDEVQILGQTTGKIETKDVSVGVTRISAEEIKIIPSVGSPDLAQYLQVLPGVIFTGDQGGQLYIRGGTPVQNMTRLDGMIIYSPFHSIGLFSVFDPDYIRTVDVYSAAYPAQFGGRVSSILDIKTRNGSFRKLGVKINLNPWTASALVEGPLTTSESGGGISFLGSFRQNFIDQTSPSLYPYVSDSIGLPFNFLDLYGKLTFSDGINYLNLFGFYQTDNVNYEFPADIGWVSSGGGSRFQLLPAEAGAIITGYFAISDYKTELKVQSETFPRNSSISGFNGGLEVAYLFNRVDEFKFGVEALGFTTDYTFTNAFGFQTRQKASNTELSVYTEYKAVIQSKHEDAYGNRKNLVVIEPGFRFHFYNNQGLSLEPRIRFKINLPRVSFSGGFGRYTQNILAATSDRDVVNFFQGFLSSPPSLGNQIKDNTLQQAWQGLFGIELELVKNLSTQVEVWGKDFTQLVSVNRDKIFPEDPDFIAETGLAYGLDIVLKYQTPKVYIYSNYGLSKVTRKDSRQTYSPVYDRRHTFNVIAAYKLGHFGLREDETGRNIIRPKFTESVWEFSIRWTLGSGFPFTQTQGYFEKLDFNDDGTQSDISSQNGQLGLILADELNGGRLPYYHRLDLSAKRRWMLGNAALLELGLSIINTYNRKNIFYFDRVEFEEIYQLPVLPSMAVTVTF